MLAAAQNTADIAAGKKDKITVCVAKGDALAYEEPSTSSTHQEAYDLYEGNSLLMTSHNNNWYRYTEGDRESYYKKSDFTTKVYDCTDGISPSYVKKHAQLHYVSEDCDIITIFELQKMGYKVHLDPAFLTISDPEHIFMIQHLGYEPLLLPSNREAINISHPQVMLTEVKGSTDDAIEFIHNQRLYMDAQLVSVDPADAVKYKYLPNEDAILRNGAVYKRIEFPGYDKMALDVKGKVKTMRLNTTGNAWVNYEFDRDGNLVRVWSGGNKYYVSRQCVCFDEDLKLMGMKLVVGSDDAVTCDEYVVEAEYKRLQSITGTDGGESYDFTCNYDAKGKLKSYTSVSYGDDEEEEEETQTEEIHITITATDANGNWTKRKVGNMVENRTITYYE